MCIYYFQWNRRKIFDEREWALYIRIFTLFVDRVRVYFKNGDIAPFVTENCSDFSDCLYLLALDKSQFCIIERVLLPLRELKDI